MLACQKKEESTTSWGFMGGGEQKCRNPHGLTLKYDNSHQYFINFCILDVEKKAYLVGDGG